MYFHGKPKVFNKLQSACYGEDRTCPPDPLLSFAIVRITSSEVITPWGCHRGGSGGITDSPKER